MARMGPPGCTCRMDVSYSVGGGSRTVLHRDPACAVHQVTSNGSTPPCSCPFGGNIDPGCPRHGVVAPVVHRLVGGAPTSGASGMAVGGPVRPPRPLPLGPYDGLDPELVPSEMIGLRTWRVDRTGRLFPVNASMTPWKPGENVASCSRSDAQQQRMGTWLPGMFAADIDPGHTFHPRCKCGFYGFHNGDNDFNGPGQVTGIIRGYGRTLVGTTGFRCEKAEIVALVMSEAKPETGDEPKPVEQPRWVRPLLFAPFVTAPLAGAGMLSLLVMGDALDDVGRWIAGISLSLIAALFVGAFTVVSVMRVLNRLKSRQRQREIMAKVEAEEKAQATGLPRVLDEPDPLAADVIERVRRCYPDVEVYASLAEAVEAHPLTPAEEPTPASDGFWTLPPKGL